MELLFNFLTQGRKLDAKLVAEAVWRDYQRGGRRDKPGFLVEYLGDTLPIHSRADTVSPKRQARHLAS